MKAASIITFLIAFIDAIWLLIWAVRRSMTWSVIAMNFESDAGKSTIGQWHIDHVRQVAADYDLISFHAIAIAVLLFAAAICWINRKDRVAV